MQCMYFPLVHCQRPSPISSTSPQIQHSGAENTSYCKERGREREGRKLRHTAARMTNDLLTVSIKIHGFESDGALVPFLAALRKYRMKVNWGGEGSPQLWVQGNDASWCGRFRDRGCSSRSHCICSREAGVSLAVPLLFSLGPSHRTTVLPVSLPLPLA